MMSEHEDLIKCIICRKPVVRSKIFAEGICLECSEKSRPSGEGETESGAVTATTTAKPHKHYYRKATGVCACGEAKETADGNSNQV